MAEQEPAKKKAWFSFDRLGGIEPFQGLVLTPRAKIFSLVRRRMKSGFVL
jgi:hypothetical protein